MVLKGNILCKTPCHGCKAYLLRYLTILMVISAIIIMEATPPTAPPMM